MRQPLIILILFEISCFYSFKLSKCLSLNVRYPIKIEFGFEHRAAGSCPVVKRMSENFDWISDLRDFIYQLNVVTIQKQKISNKISITTHSNIKFHPASL